MNAPFRLEQCLSFIHCNLQPMPRRIAAGQANRPRWRAITISRQTGSGAHDIAEMVARQLEESGRAGWTVVDRDIVERVLEEHHLPHNLARLMPEDRVSLIDEALEELRGLHLPAATLVEKTAETVLHLAEQGNVILIGRGSTVITSRLDYVLHVRLVGSLPKRAEYLRQRLQLTEKAALDLIRKEDHGRHRYLKTYFGKEIEDPSLYHLVINTDLVGHQGAAEMLAGIIRGQA